MQVQDGPNYKKKYKTLKRKLRMLIYEQECFAEELRKAQRKLLRISRDKSFLLDRLLQYEEIDPSATDTDVTESSGSDEEHIPTPKRKKVSGTPLSTKGSPAPNVTPTRYIPNPVTSMSSDAGPPRKKTKVIKKGKAAATSVSNTPVSATSPGHMMRPPSSHTLPSPVSRSPQGHLTSPRSGGVATQQQLEQRLYQRAALKSTVTVRSPRAGSGANVQRITMTREEVEQHLERQSNAKPEFMSLERTPMIMPDNIFNDNSNSCDFPDSKTTDDEDLVIDMP